jgi:hypothetical protein
MALYPHHPGSCVHRMRVCAVDERERADQARSRSRRHHRGLNAIGMHERDSLDAIGMHERDSLDAIGMHERDSLDAIGMHERDSLDAIGMHERDSL